MILRKYCRDKDALYLYHEMDRHGLLTNRNIGTDSEFVSYFEHQLRNYYSDFWIIEDSLRTHQEGFLYTWDYRVRDGHCHFDYYISSGNQNDIQEIIKNTLKMLFIEYPLNCIYIHITSDDSEKVMICDSLNAEKEAVLKDYRYKNGNYIDVQVMSFARKIFSY